MSNRIFQLQLKRLMDASTPSEKKRLQKHVKPIDAPTNGGPLHISGVLPEVMANIEYRSRRLCFERN